MIACQTGVLLCLAAALFSCTSPKITAAHSAEIATISNISSPADTLLYLPQNGEVKETYQGKPLFQAHLKKGKLQGVWQAWYTNGNNCDSGTLVHNLPDGIWKYWDANGNLKAIREYSADKYQRIKMEMTRYNPRRNFYQLAALYQQNQQAATHYLTAAYSFPSAKKMSGKLNALRELVKENSSGAYTPVYDHCLHEGLYMNFFENGATKDSGYYKDGLKAGKWVHYETPQGGSEQGKYQHGLRVKDWKVYNTAGRLTTILHYDRNGNLQWQKKINR